jgi:tetraacyldisaccharide 4'-kinase
VGEEATARIEQELRRHNAFAPLYCCRHAHAHFITPDDRRLPPDLRGRSYLAFCGIGNPEAFTRQLESTGGRRAATHFFADHHAYVDRDLAMLENLARTTASDVMVTTEKDWVKLRHLSRATQTQPTVWRVELSIEFADDGGARLVEQLLPGLPPPAIKGAM